MRQIGVEAGGLLGMKVIDVEMVEIKNAWLRLIISRGEQNGYFERRT